MSLGRIVACDAPSPEAGAPGPFAVQRVEGLRYRTVDHVETSAHGCVDTLVRELSRGTSEADRTEANRLPWPGTGGDSTASAPLVVAGRARFRSALRRGVRAVGFPERPYSPASN